MPPNKNNLEEKDINVGLLLSNIKQRLNLSDKEISELSNAQEIRIPISIFTSKLGMLESIVLYLRKDLNLSFRLISTLLKRDYQTVYASYRKAKEKKR